VGIIPTGMVAATSTDIWVFSTVDGVPELTRKTFKTSDEIEVRNAGGIWEGAFISVQYSPTRFGVQVSRDNFIETVPYDVGDMRHYRLINEAAWTQQNDLLILTFSHGLPANALLKISIDTSGFGGFKIPETGITKDSLQASGQVSVSDMTNMWNSMPKEDFGWITKGTSTFTIASKSVDGPVLPQPIERVESVMAFVNTSLSFSPSVVSGQRGELEFRFAVTEPLGPRDELFLHLPGFRRECLVPTRVNRFLFSPDNTCQETDNFIVPPDLYTFLSVKPRTKEYSPAVGPRRAIDLFWSDFLQTFRMVVLEPIGIVPSRLEFINLILSEGWSFSLVVPPNGVRCQDPALRPHCKYNDTETRRLSQPALMLSALAARGQMDKFDIHEVQPLGSFSPPAQIIEFQPAKRGEVTSIKLLLVPTMDVFPEESLTVSLPGFFRDEAAQVKSDGVIAKRYVDVETQSLVSFSFVWSQVPAELRITLESGKINAGESTTLVITSDARISLPQEGVLDDTGIVISSDAFDGSVRHQAMLFPRVGTVGDLSMSFQPAQAGRPTKLTFNFSPVMGMLQDESCLLKLPLFTRRTDTGLDLTSIPSILVQGVSYTEDTSSNFDVAWETGHDTPALRVTARYPTETSHSIVIDEINWIRVPDLGISEWSEPMSLRCNLTSGLIDTDVPPQVYIAIFPPGSSLSFHPASAGLPTQMEVKIVYSADIKIGDIVSFKLPKFFSLSNSMPETFCGSLETFCGRLLKLSGEDFRSFAARWNEATETMHLQAIENLPQRGNNISITVMAYQGLSLPISGIRKTGHGITIRTNAKGGVVLATLISQVMPVGTFETSILDFDPPRAGKPEMLPRDYAVLGFDFSPLMNIRAGEKIVFSLRGFEALEMTRTNVSTGKFLFNPAVTLVQTAAENSLTVVTYIVPEPGIMAGQRRRIVTEKTIKLPLDGVLLTQTSLTISCKAADGLVEAEAIKKWQPVGSFTDSPRLNCDSLDVLTSMAMQIAFIPRMRINVGESVTFHLPDFSGPSQTIELSVSPNMSVPQAKWDSSTRLLVIKASNVFEPNVEVLIDLLDNSMRLPPNGVDDKTESFISSDAAAGPVLPTRIAILNKVAVIYDSRIRFGNPRPGQVSNLIIQFRLRTAVVPGDQVQVGLPGFSLPTTFHQSRFFTDNKNWAQAEFVQLEPDRFPALNMFATQEASGSLFQVTIPSSAHIYLPIRGLKLNQRTLTIRSTAKIGSTVSTPFSSVQPVGSFTTSTKMVLQDPLNAYAGKYAAFVVSFIPEMNLAPGEYIWITLPNFVRVKEKPLADSIDFDAVNDFTGGYNISLVAVRHIGPGELLNIHVTGLALPVKGLRLIQDDLSAILISSNAILGPLPTIPILQVPVIGAISSSSMSFDVPKASTVSPILFSITPAMQLGCPPEQLLKKQCLQDGMEKSMIRIRLKDFTRTTTGPLPDCGGLDDCSWDPSSQSITLVTDEYVAPETELRFKIPASAGLALPSQGVLTDDTEFTVFVSTTWGNVFPTSIQSTQGVGSFRQSSIKFSRGSILAAANTDTLIEIEFVYVFTSLLRSDTINLRLPGLRKYVPKSNFIVKWRTTNSTYNSTAEASWSESKETMTLTVPAKLKELTTSFITVEMAAGFRLPPWGNMRNNPAFKIGTEKMEGPVPAVSFEMSTPVGAFATSELIFESRRAGSLTPVSVKLHINCTLGNRETITITLPTFSGPVQRWTQLASSMSNFTLTVEPCQHCSPQPATRIQVTIGAPILQDTLFQFIVPLDAGIRIPADGVVLNQAGPQVSTPAREGPVCDTSFISVKAVGELLKAEMYFIPVSTLEPVNIKLVLQLSNRTTFTAGDTLQFFLPGFTSSAGVPCGPGPQGYVTKFYWNASTFMLNVAVGKSIHPGEIFSFTVPSSCGIYVPIQGIQGNTRDITVSVTSETGPVPTTSLTSVLGVSALSFLNLTLGSPLPLQQSSLTLMFALSQALQIGSQVTLVLPGFEASSSTIYLDKNTVANTYFDNVGLWLQGTEETLTLTQATMYACEKCQDDTPCHAARILFTTDTYIPEFTNVIIRVAAGWIRLPSMGVREPEKVLRFIVSTKEGNVITSGNVEKSTKVKALLTNLELLLLAPFAGRSSSMIVQFDVTENIPAGTSLTISLPHFDGKDKWQVHCYRDLVAFGSNASCAYFQERSSWDRTYARFVRYVNQAAAPVTSTALPLSGRAQTPAVTSNFTAVWQPDLQILRLTSVSAISAGRIAITVPSTSGIRVPLTGLKAGRTGITVVFSIPLMDARSQSIVAVNTSPMPVPVVSEAGALFHSSSLKFMNGQYNAKETRVADMRVQLNITAGLNVSDTITLILPSFGGPRNLAQFVQKDTTRNITYHIKAGLALFFAEWKSVDQQLVLKVTQGRVYPKDVLDITIPSEWNMYLPSNGVHMDSGVMISVQESASGAAWRSTFESLNLIGVFVDTNLSFSPALGKQGQIELGKSVSISVKIGLTVELTTGSCISVVLPGIQGLPFLKQVVRTQSLSPEYAALLPSRGPNCPAMAIEKNPEKKMLADKQVGVQGGVVLPAPSCQGQECSCDWYGPRCDLYCDHLATCNAQGLCSRQGSCICFPPFYGAFCNSSLPALDVSSLWGGKGCQVESSGSVDQGSSTSETFAQRTTFDVKWNNFDSLLQFCVKSAPLPAWTALFYEMPAGLRVSSLISRASFGVVGVSNASDVTVLAFELVRPKCYSRRLIVGPESLCAGVVPVRVCATSPAAADVSLSIAFGLEQIP
jgi:hypothetical protein